jgi:hypothetical protein
MRENSQTKKSANTPASTRHNHPTLTLLFLSRRFSTMMPTFTLKYKKTHAGPPNEDVEFELVDYSSGVQRRVDWQSSPSLGNFVRLRRLEAFEILTFP